MLIQHVQEALEKANLYQSKITEGILEIEGMSGKKTRHFYNNICAMEDARYLEIGVWKGSSVCAAMCNNHMTCVCVDNWSEFDGPKEEFLQNFERFKGGNTASFIEANCWDLDAHNLGRFNIYMYDGDHDEVAHYYALKHFLPCLYDEFIYLVDDWNWEQVRQGTFESIKSNDLQIAYQREIFTNGGIHPPEHSITAMLSEEGEGDVAGRHGDWHNGVCVFVLERRKYENNR